MNTIESNNLGDHVAHLVTKDQTHIYYTDVGQGDPVVLIHGWPLSSAMWEYQAQALLANGHRVIMYDRRGFGKSSQPYGSYNYDVFADDLKEVLDHVQVNKAALVGFSMGGGEIARYLSRHGSSKISRVALVASVVPYQLKTADNPNGAPEAVFNEMISNLREDRPKFLRNFAKMFYGSTLVHHAVSDEFLDWNGFLAYQAAPWATIDCVNAFGKTDFRPDLKAFNIPTLVIHGSGDKTVSVDAAGRAAAKGIAGAIYKEYEGAPHGLFATHKNQLNEDLLSFLGKK